MTLSDGGNYLSGGESRRGYGGVGTSCGKPCLKFSGTSWACCAPRKKRASESGTRQTREGRGLSDQVPFSYPVQSTRALTGGWPRGFAIPNAGPPYRPEDFRYPGWKSAPALLESTDMDSALCPHLWDDPPTCGRFWLEGWVWPPACGLEWGQIFTHSGRS